MKAVVAAFNQEKALVGAFSVITNLRMELFEALVYSVKRHLLEVVDVVVGPGEAGDLPDRGRQHQQQQRGLSEGRPEVRPNLPRVTCVMCHVSRVQKLQPTSASLEDSVLVSALSDDDSLLLRVSLLNIFVKYFFWCI